MSTSRPNNALLFLMTPGCVSSPVIGTNQPSTTFLNGTSPCTRGISMQGFIGALQLGGLGSNGWELVWQSNLNSSGWTSLGTSTALTSSTVIATDATGSIFLDCTSAGGLCSSTTTTVNSQIRVAVHNSIYGIYCPSGAPTVQASDWSTGLNGGFILNTCA